MNINQVKKLQYHLIQLMKINNDKIISLHEKKFQYYEKEISILKIQKQ